MDPVLNARDVNVGFHPTGYRIDKTAAPMNRYTKWDIIESHWCNPKPVCFDSLPEKGWLAVDKFDWNNFNVNEE
jgi:hypothetical protein